MKTPDAIPVVTRSIKRFRSDFRRRYPEKSGRSPVQLLRPKDQGQDEPATEAQVRLQKLPPEIGVLLIVVGTAGILLPGPVGSPFLVAGGIALWPSGFRKVGASRCREKCRSRDVPGPESDRSSSSYPIWSVATRDRCDSDRLRVDR